jgi:hypothetical protein
MYAKKIYCNLSTEKASKGFGGNDYLGIELLIGTSIRNNKVFEVIEVNKEEYSKTELLFSLYISKKLVKEQIYNIKTKEFYDKSSAT